MSATPQSALFAFLRAFSRLDLDAMLDCFAQEATAFFPAEHQRTRLEGANFIGKAFAEVIARLRMTGTTNIPLDAENLVVQDLVVQEWGETAIATFHLRGERLSRRTVVMRRQAEQWRIIHLHASNAPRDG